MAAEFHCHHCSLAFAVGWDHYHDLSTGYAAQTLLVCKECGTGHCVQHAIKPRAPSWFAKLLGEKPPNVVSVPDKLLAQPGPLILSKWSEKVTTSEGEQSEIAIWTASRYYKGWIELTPPQPIRPWHFTRHTDPWNSAILEGCQEPLTLDECRCGHCGATGSLVSDWLETQEVAAFQDERFLCPACKQFTLEMTGTWMT